MLEGVWIIKFEIALSCVLLHEKLKLCSCLFNQHSQTCHIKMSVPCNRSCLGKTDGPFIEAVIVYVSLLYLGIGFKTSLGMPQECRAH